MYKIVRTYESDRWPSRTVRSGLTLAEAQEHCGDPETSSRTCTEAQGVRRTRERGQWFDGYEEA